MEQQDRAPVHPRKFIATYVDPAIKLYKENQTIKHLAVHAIAQLDVLAAVVALWCAGVGKLKKGQESEFRNKLGDQVKTIAATLRDLHNCHKHGGLHYATVASRGQRPQHTQAAIFLNHYYMGQPPTPYGDLAVVLDDGTKLEVCKIIHEARQAWEEELARLKL